MPIRIEKEDESEEKMPFAISAKMTLVFYE
jgi:hypothetical protein